MTPTAASRMTRLIGEEIERRMQQAPSPSAAAQVAAYLVHEKVPCNGEMFRIGGGGFRRVFIGVTQGYQ